METDTETNEQLLHRFEHVNNLLNKSLKQLNKMKSGGNRDRKARWCGSLGFTLAQIKSKIEERELDYEL